MGISSWLADFSWISLIIPETTSNRYRFQAVATLKNRKYNELCYCSFEPPEFLGVLPRKTREEIVNSILPSKRISLLQRSQV
jgi:hypothetical protein